MRIVGIVCRTNKNIDDSYNFECLEAVSRVFSKYDNVVPIMILPTKDIIYNETKSGDECVFDNEKYKKLDAVLDKCDGFLIPGGCKWYGHDEYIIKYAIKNDKSLLGICLGMQIIGVMDNRLNSGLFDTTIKNETIIKHQQPGVNYVHEVEIIENTLLYEVLQTKTIKVNSRHNYHIGGVVNLNIDAVSEDGLIEAVSLPNKKFILGVQWHPENMIDYDENSKKIFDCFVSKL